MVAESYDPLGPLRESPPTTPPDNPYEEPRSVPPTGDPLYQTKALSDISPEIESRINELLAESFKMSTDSYVSQFPRETLVSYATVDGYVGGVALGEIKVYECDASSGGIPEMVNIHSISVDPAYRGKGFCKGLVREMTRSFVGKPIYLNVRISRDDPNVGGIRCYEANGFRVIPVPPVMRDDGPNFYMVRDNPTRKKTRKKTRKR